MENTHAKVNLDGAYYKAVTAQAIDAIIVSTLNADEIRLLLALLSSATPKADGWDASLASVPMMCHASRSVLDALAGLVRNNVLTLHHNGHYDATAWRVHIKPIDQWRIDNIF